MEARQGPAPDPDLVVVGEAESFLAVASGRLSPEEAVQSGALRADGEREEDREALLAWCRSLVGPRPRRRIRPGQDGANLAL